MAAPERLFSRAEKKHIRRRRWVVREPVLSACVVVGRNKRYPIVSVRALRARKRPRGPPAGKLQPECRRTLLASTLSSAEGAPPIPYAFQRRRTSGENGRQLVLRGHVRQTSSDAHRETTQRCHSDRICLSALQKNGLMCDRLGVGTATAGGREQRVHRMRRRRGDLGVSRRATIRTSPFVAAVQIPHVWSARMPRGVRGRVGIGVLSGF